jgi:hypothetical protein
MKMPEAFPFNEPVDPVKLGIPDYFEVITHPMDFSTIKKNLDTEQYHTFTEFIADVNLVFRNARTYNPSGNDLVTCFLFFFFLMEICRLISFLFFFFEDNPVHQMAVNLNNIFQQKLASTNWEKCVENKKENKKLNA